MQRVAASGSPPNVKRQRNSNNFVDTSPDQMFSIGIEFDLKDGFQVHKTTITLARKFITRFRNPRALPSQNMIFHILY